MRAASPIAAAFSVLLAAAAARADVTVDAGFGFDGVHVPGCATPVRVTLSSTEKGPITVRLELSPSGTMGGLGDGLVQVAETYLAPGARKRLTLPVVTRAYSFGEEWTLRVRTDRRTLIRSGVEYQETRDFTIKLAAAAGTISPTGRFEQGAPVLGVLGDPGNRLGWLGSVTDEEVEKGRARRVPGEGVVLKGPGGNGDAPVPTVIPISPECAPDTWLGYEGFDAILWVDPDPSALGDQARLDALLEWALNGGRLIVALTPGSRIPAGSATARALPVESLGYDDVESRQILSALTGSAAGVRPGPVPVARCGPPRARVLKALEDGRPLLVAGSHGLGTVVALTFDPRLLAGTASVPRASLLRLLLGSAGEAAEGDDAYGGSLIPLLNHFSKRFVKTPPLALLILGLALYVLAIGPVDYILLKRRNRLRRTVVTFPLIVLGFTVAAYAASFLLFGAAGGQARVAVLDLATAPARDADVVRGIDLLGTYSPVGRTLAVSVEAPRSLLAAPWLSASGYLERNSSFAGEVVHAPDGRPTAFVDIPLRSFRTVQSRFSGEVAASLEAEWVDRGGRPMLRVVNRLEARLRDACFVGRVGTGAPVARALGDLEPGAAIEVDPAHASVLKIGSDPLLPDPFRGSTGLFSQAGGEDAFVPRDGSDEASEAARVAVGRALLGASVAAVRGTGETRATRMLARQGLEMSRAILGGRSLVQGWCDALPIGGMLPDGGSVRSTVVLVRRLLPAEESR